MLDISVRSTAEGNIITISYPSSLVDTIKLLIVFQVAVYYRMDTLESSKLPDALRYIEQVSKITLMGLYIWLIHLHGL